MLKKKIDIFDVITIFGRLNLAILYVYIVIRHTVCILELENIYCRINLRHVAAYSTNITVYGIVIDYNVYILYRYRDRDIRYNVR